MNKRHNFIMHYIILQHSLMHIHYSSPRGEKKPSWPEEEEENPAGSAYLEHITTWHWRSGMKGERQRAIDVHYWT